VQSYLIDFGLNAGYILLAIAAVLSLLFPIIHLVRNPKQAGTSLMGLGIVAVIFLIAYGVSSGEILLQHKDDITVTSSLSRWVGAGIITMYIFVGLAFLSFIASEIKTLFN
jgi:hypothetical protein